MARSCILQGQTGFSDLTIVDGCWKVRKYPKEDAEEILEDRVLNELVGQR